MATRVCSARKCREGPTGDAPAIGLCLPPARYERAGESVFLDKALWPEAERTQEERRAQDAWEIILADIPREVKYDRHHFAYETPKRIVHVVGNEERVATLDLLEDILQIPNAAQLRQTDTMRLSSVMKALGWGKDDNKLWIGGKQKQVRGFSRPWIDPGIYRNWIDQGVLDRIKHGPGGGLSKDPEDNEGSVAGWA